MTGIEPPREPVAPAPLVHPLTVPAQRTSWVPGMVGLGIFLVLGSILGGVMLSVTAAALADSADLSAAERAVMAFDEAYEQGDCDAFEQLTTDDVRGDILGRNYDCDAFEAAATALTDGGDYAYSVSVLRTAKFDDTVVVKTRESFGDEASERYTYLLENDGDGWVIAGYGRD